MIKYGLKLRSTNQDLFDDAINTIKKGYFDGIELYIVPDKFGKEGFEKIKNAEIKISFHLPHSAHDFNPIDKGNDAEKIWGIVKEYIDYLSPFQIIMHPEHGDDLQVLKRRLDRFHDKRILIENMPKYPIKGYSFRFFGYTLDQLQQIKGLGYSICLDFEKAVKSALAQGIDYKEFILQIIKEFSPTYFHISGCDLEVKEDQHLNLRETGFDIKWIKDLLIEIGNKKDIYIVLETPRILGNFDNDVKNLNYFKKIDSI